MGKQAWETFSVSIENVGAEALDTKFGIVNVGCRKGRIIGMRVHCPTPANVTSYQVSVYKDQTIINWTPEHQDCIIWSDDIDVDTSHAGGWELDTVFKTVDNSNFLAVAIKMVGTSVTDDYTVELDVEVEL